MPHQQDHHNWLQQVLCCSPAELIPGTTTPSAALLLASCCMGTIKLTGPSSSSSARCLPLEGLSWAQSGQLAGRSAIRQKSFLLLYSTIPTHLSNTPALSAAPALRFRSDYKENATRAQTRRVTHRAARDTGQATHPRSSCCPTNVVWPVLAALAALSSASSSSSSLPIALGGESETRACLLLWWI